MVEVGILTALFVLEVLKYGKAYELLMGKRLERWWVVITGAIGVFVFFFLGYGPKTAGRYTIAYGVALVAVFLMMNAVWYRRLANILILLFVLNIIDPLMEIVHRTIQVLFSVDVKVQNFNYLVMSLLTLGMLILLQYSKARFKMAMEWIAGFVYKRVYYLVIFMAMTMLFAISGLNSAKKYIVSDRFTIFAMITCALAFVGIGILGMFVIYIRNTNIKIEEMLENEKQQKLMQKQYYEMLLEKEEDTRRYRHDMLNHLVCLNNLAHKEAIEELQGYLATMQEQMETIQNKCYVTGNQILDVITNYYLANFDNATVKVSGCLTGNLQIDNVSLCTIYANLMANAIEELERVEGIEKSLNITFIEGTEYFQMIIQNSISNESMKKEEILVTEKKDKQNHGLGLKNVKRAIEENGGRFQTKRFEQYFEVEVTLKMT